MIYRSSNISKPGRIRIPSACSRCGGAGWSSAWRFTGAVCYRCGGQTPVITAEVAERYGLSEFFVGRHLDPSGSVVYGYPADWTDEQVAEHEAKRAERAAARAARKAEREQAEQADWLATVPEFAALLARADEFHADPFISDVLSQGARKPLSARQVEAVLAAVVRRAERIAKAEREAAEAEPLPVGRVQIEGEVVSMKTVESDWGSSVKMLVRGKGWKVWGSVPSSLRVERGDRVRFTATVEASRDDDAFGFYKRPTKAEVLEAA